MNTPLEPPPDSVIQPAFDPTGNGEGMARDEAVSSASEDVRREPPFTSDTSETMPTSNKAADVKRAPATLNAALPDGLAIFKLEIWQGTPSSDDLLDDGWETDFVRKKLGVVNWEDKRSSLTPSQRVALTEEKDRRDKIEEQYRAQSVEYGDFLRGRGALVTRYFDTKNRATTFTTFLVAPAKVEHDVKMLFATPERDDDEPRPTDYWVHSIEQVTPDALLSVARTKKGYYFGFEATPCEGETAVAYAMRAKATNLDADLQLWKLVGGDIAAFNRMHRMQRRNFTADEKVRFLVEGLIPRDAITLLVGARKRGKSAWLTELAVTVASGGGQFCGFNVPERACKGVAVLISGEDNEAVLGELLVAMDPKAEAVRLYPIAGGNRSLTDILKDFDTTPAVSLLVVDPARKYILGQEDDSGALNDFFNDLQGFIDRHKGCAVVVAHHPKGSGRFSSIEDIVENARGSTVFRDRARVHIGLNRTGETKTIGIPVIDGVAQHNMPPSVAMCEGRVNLVRDPATMRHKRVDDRGARESERATVEAMREQVSAHVAAVVAAVRRITGEGGRVTRTGGSSLFKQKKRAPEIIDMSRRQIEDAVDAAIDQGLLQNGAAGLMAP